MRAAKSLRSLAVARRQVRRMNEMDRVVRAADEGRSDRPETFYATSGTSTIETTGERWMPHYHRPIVGFTSNPGGAE
jgi:hypothetical protein